MWPCPLLLIGEEGQNCMTGSSLCQSVMRGGSGKAWLPSCWQTTLCQAVQLGGLLAPTGEATFYF